MDEGVVRMDAQKWALVAEMFAVVASVDGMKAENAERHCRGYGDAWGATSFFNAEEELKSIAQKLRNTI